MPSSITVSLGGYTFVFGVAAILLVLIVLGIFVFRQIQRIRINSARREISCTIAPDASKKTRAEILSTIEDISALRSSLFPRFTDCNMISEHANQPYVQRMIGFDEIISGIDRQLEKIHPSLARRPGQSTYAYLLHIRSLGQLNDLSDRFIERISLLHEVCRFRTTVPFGDAELEEVRSLLADFAKILTRHHELLDAAITSQANDEPQGVGGRLLRRAVTKKGSGVAAESIPLLTIKSHKERPKR
uniref:PXA domain-containing protein n=1 Tax=Panagrellus redivivus TaxID=6233 RepID=A0A7E4ZT89_PANRE